MAKEEPEMTHPHKSSQDRVSARRSLEPALNESLFDTSILQFDLYIINLSPYCLGSKVPHARAQSLVSGTALSLQHWHQLGVHFYNNILSSYCLFSVERPTCSQEPSLPFQVPRHIEIIALTWGGYTLL